MIKPANVKIQDGGHLQLKITWLSLIESTICTKYHVNQMNSVENRRGGEFDCPPPPPPSIAETIFTSRFLGLKFSLIFVQLWFVSLLLYNIDFVYRLTHSIGFCVFRYTGGILQRLDTDVHSTVTAKTSTVL